MRSVFHMVTDAGARTLHFQDAYGIEAETGGPGHPGRYRQAGRLATAIGRPTCLSKGRSSDERRRPRPPSSCCMGRPSNRLSPVVRQNDHMKSDYDLIVIGGGPARTLAAATAAHDEGLRDILIVEKDRFLSGHTEPSASIPGLGCRSSRRELTGPEYPGDLWTRPLKMASRFFSTRWSLP